MFYTSLNNLNTYKVVRTNPTCFLGGWTRFWTQNSGWVGSGWPLGSKNGSNRVRLAANRVQIWIQPYNVLNKPDLNPNSGWVGLGPQGPNSGWVRLGWLGSVGHANIKTIEFLRQVLETSYVAMVKMQSVVGNRYNPYFLRVQYKCGWLQLFLTESMLFISQGVIRNPSRFHTPHVLTCYNRN